MLVVGSACGVDLPDALPAPGEVGQTYEVLAWGLSSPRGLAVDETGGVYVAEAGSGGPECVDPKAGKCFGFSGAIHRYTNLGTADPGRTTVASGLLSTAIPNANGAEVVGIDGIDLTDDGELIGVIGFSSPGLRAGFGSVTPNFVPSEAVGVGIDNFAGHVIRVGRAGEVSAVVDVGSVNYAWAAANKDAPWAPTGQYPDSNPYAVLAEGGRIWVVDSGANTVSELVEENGTTVPRLISYVPSPAPGLASVPTCVAKHGEWLYVGTLDFAGNFSGDKPTSHIYRINLAATDPFTSAEVWAEGFNPITGCIVIDDEVYVTEYGTKATKYAFGAVVRIRINDDGSAGSRHSMGTDLVQPTGIAALGRSIIVTHYGTAPAGSGPDVPGGQIVRLLS